MDRNASNNSFSVGASRNRLHDATPAQPSQTQTAGEDLVEQFLAALDRSFQEHGREILHTVMTKRPRLYFRALVMLAQVQHRGSSKLSDLDRQRNRAEALLRLERRQVCGVAPQTVGIVRNNAVLLKSKHRRQSAGGRLAIRALP